MSEHALALPPSASPLTLLDLVLRLRWSTIAERAVTHPQEIAEQDDDGLTVLHWACCNDPPPQMIQILLEQDEQFASSPKDRAAHLKDANGMTPLLNACACRASVAVVSCLIEAVPESVSTPDSDGWTALHYICCSALNIGAQYAYHVAEQLLNVDSSCVRMKDNNGRTPLFLLCHMYEDELQRCFVMEGVVSRERRRRNRIADETGGFQYLPSTVDEFWALASLIIVSSLPGLAGNSSSVIHYIASIPDCHPVLIKVATTYYSEHLRQQDDRGNTPLHLAASTVERSPLLLRALVDADPHATQIRNHDGALPLAIALGADCGWTSGHAALLDAHPVALESCCLKEVYYPYLLAHVTSPSTVFELLRAKPNLARGS